jgi:formylglycine-generating enzyme required for sulfatase activity
MVSIPGPASDAGTTNYKIDATEVTHGQYAAWLATNPALPSSTDANCGWNTSYAPPSTCKSASSCQTDCGHLPQECVDWCDAFAYCAGVGKRLCGAVSGGSNSFSAFKDPSLSQWHRACSSGGLYLSPYGNTPDDTKCNEYGYWAPNYDSARTLPVGSLPGCQSPLQAYAGVYDQDGKYGNGRTAATPQAKRATVASAVLDSATMPNSRAARRTPPRSVFRAAAV